MHHSTLAAFLALAAATASALPVLDAEPASSPSWGDPIASPSPSATCKVPTVATPNAQDVLKSINQWAIDVTTVNSFLDLIVQINDSSVIEADTKNVRLILPSLYRHYYATFKVLTVMIHRPSPSPPTSPANCRP
jgi:hypothetical protein